MGRAAASRSVTSQGPRLTGAGFRAPEQEAWCRVKAVEKIGVRQPESVRDAGVNVRVGDKPPGMKSWTASRSFAPPSQQGKLAPPPRPPPRRRLSSMITRSATGGLWLLIAPPSEGSAGRAGDRLRWWPGRRPTPRRGSNRRLQPRPPVRAPDPPGEEHQRQQSRPARRRR